MRRYTFIDLFAGCGGLSEGFYKQNFKSLTHVEIDSYACKTLKTRMLHYGYSEDEASVIEEDITNENIIEKINSEIAGQKVDLIVGGPPCQSFSSLGRAKDENGMADDPRNYLFESYVKILNYFEPKIFVFENVTGLLSAKLNGKLIIKKILRELGKKYNLLENPEEMVLNSSDYGVPQIRKRIILIGTRKDLSINPLDIYKGIIKTHSNSDSNSDLKKYITVKDAISDLPAIMPGEGKIVIEHNVRNQNDFLSKIRNTEDKFLRDHVARTHNDSDRLRYRTMSKNKWTFADLLEKRPDLNHIKQRVFNNSYVVQWWDQPSKTIIAHLYKDGNQFIHPDYKQERTLTPREAARLQSFPDDFVFEGSRTQQYKQIGNAVPPLMAEAIAISIKKTLERIENV